MGKVHRVKKDNQEGRWKGVTEKKKTLLAYLLKKNCKEQREKEGQCQP